MVQFWLEEVTYQYCTETHLPWNFAQVDVDDRDSVLGHQNLVHHFHSQQEVHQKMATGPLRTFHSECS